MKRKILILSCLLISCLGCSLVNGLVGFTRAKPTLEKQPTAAVQATNSMTAPEALKPENRVSPTDTPPAAPVKAAETGPTFGQPARVYLEYLSGRIGQRVDNTIGARQAVEYIREQFTQMGYEPEEQPFSYEDEDGGKARSANVIAVKKGQSERQIIVGAHYDSAADGGSLGADDNASGVAVVMEAAERLQTLEPFYTIKFVAFGGEEVDLLGSAYYVSQMTRAEKDNTLVYINFDSLLAGNKTYIYGSGGEKGKVRNWALETAKTLSLNLQGQPKFSGGEEDDYSDHAAFRKAGIPFVYFEATDWALGDEDGWTQVDPQYGDNGEIWHTQYDNLTYLEATFPGRVNDHLSQFSTILYHILTDYRE